MWQKFDTFEPGTDFLAWASTIAFYEARNFQRLAVRSPRVFDENLLALLARERLQDLGEQHRRLEALEHCLTKLREPDRELVCSVYQDRLAIKTLAERFGRAPQTLYNKLNHIRRMLAECVQRRLMEEDA